MWMRLLKLKGFGMVEAVVAVSVISAFLLVLSGVNFAYLRLAFGESNKIQAAFLAEESLEVVRFLRDSSWNTNLGTISLGVNYYPVFNGTGWLLQTNYSTVGIFYPTVSFDAVYRDANDSIVSSGGTLDPNTYLVTSTVSWQERNATSTKVISTYITDLFDN